MTLSPQRLEKAVPTPEMIAEQIVANLSLSSNRMLNGRLVGEQHFAYEAIVAAIRQDRRRHVPDGYVVMPITATPAMVKAYIGADRRRKRYAATAKRDWAAFLSAELTERDAG